MRLPLRYYGDPVLKRRATPVATVDDRLRRLAQDMIETMHAEEGIGLAAQQVGETVALCVVDVPAHCDADAEGRPLNPGLVMPMVMFNPHIIRASEPTEAREEGCLSFPEIRAKIVRPSEVTVRWMDEDGREREATLRGLTARCVQHEMDHLEGILFIDHLSKLKRDMVLKKLQKARRLAA